MLEFSMSRKAAKAQRRNAFLISLRLGGFA
jgi:hypothetical protein